MCIFLCANAVNPQPRRRFQPCSFRPSQNATNGRGRYIQTTVPISTRTSPNTAHQAFHLTPHLPLPNLLRRTPPRHRQQPRIRILRREHRTPMFQKRLHALNAVGRGARRAPRAHQLAARLLVHLVRLLERRARERARLRRAPDAAQRRERQDQADEGGVGREGRSGAGGAGRVRVARVPALPVLPRRVCHGVVAGGPAGAVRGRGRGRGGEVGVGAAGPAVAVLVVGTAFGRVGEQGVGGDEEAVALQAGGAWQRGDG